MIKLTQLLSEAVNKYKFLGPCDRVRAKSAQNEEFWHGMMKNKKKISDKLFVNAVDMDAMLDDDENAFEWIRDNKRQDGSAASYKSTWGKVSCMFYQVAGFEYIFVK